MPDSQVRRAQRGPSGASFVPGMVHEIRNFAFAISASLDAFEARMGPGAAERRYTDMIRARLERLMAFMAEVKDYGEPMGLHAAALSPEALLRGACDRAAPLASERGIALELRIPEGIPEGRGDAEALGKALGALLDLLLRMGRPGARLEVELEAAPEGLSGSLEVRPAELQGLDAVRLMEPFFYKIQGCAHLGPAIARRTLEAHGGRVAASETPQGGLRLVFSLPN